LFNNQKLKTEFWFRRSYRSGREVHESTFENWIVSPEPVMHFKVPATSRRMRPHLSADSFSILAPGPHQFLVELETEPKAVVAAQRLIFMPDFMDGIMSQAVSISARPF
jgi:hypothetical protein